MEGSSSLVHHWALLGQSVPSDAGFPLSVHHSGLMNNKNNNLIFFLFLNRKVYSKEKEKEEKDKGQGLSSLF